MKICDEFFFYVPVVLTKCREHLNGVFTFAILMQKEMNSSDKPSLAKIHSHFFFIYTLSERFELSSLWRKCVMLHAADMQRKRRSP